MTRSGAALILALAGALPASSADLPSRKPGLWEIRMNVGNNSATGAPGQTIRQCIDAATDQIMQSSAGAFAQSACAKRDVQRSAKGITIDSTCTIGGRAATSHAVIAGSFDSAYTMTVTSQSEALPGGTSTMTMSAQWLGPCAVDQKPGDMIMGNGVKLNIIDMQKRPPSTGIPLPPR